MTMIDAVHPRPTIAANDRMAANADADAWAIGVIFARGHDFVSGSVNGGVVRGQKRFVTTHHSTTHPLLVLEHSKTVHRLLNLRLDVGKSPGLRPSGNLKDPLIAVILDDSNAIG